jgi:hypothetical protein
MPNRGAWLRDTPAIERTAPRAVSAWKRINDRPSSVVFNRGGVALTTQTVRVEENSGGPESTSPVAVSGVQGVVIYGVMDHPDGSIPDTDMERGDRFWIDGKQYEITGIVKTFGEIQAFGEATT